MAVTPDRPRVVRVTVPGIQGPQGPTGLGPEGWAQRASGVWAPDTIQAQLKIIPAQ